MNFWIPLDLFKTLVSQYYRLIFLHKKAIKYMSEVLEFVFPMHSLSTNKLIIQLLSNLLSYFMVTAP